MRRFGKAATLLAAIGAAVALGAAPAQGAFNDPIYVYVPPVVISGSEDGPAPTNRFNGPCGLAVNSSGQFLVSDYYHHTITAFSAGSAAESPKTGAQITNVDPLDGPCGLAIDGSGSIYVNNYHRNVQKSPAGGTIFDEGHPTGVAVDVANNVYVNNRTHITEYTSGGVEVQQIGAPTLADGFGVAVSHYAGTLGYVYVPDAATNTVKVYDPLTDAENPKAEIKDPFSKPFVSLRDSAVAVDRVTGEIYIADNVQPRYAERPQTTIYVYNPNGTWKGYLKYKVVDAHPPGLAVDNSAGATQGRVYVTSGNTDEAGVYAYPKGAASTANPLPSTFSLSVNATGGGSGQVAAAEAELACSGSCATELRSGRDVTLSAAAEEGSVFEGFSGEGCGGEQTCTVTMDEARSVDAEFEQLAGPPSPSSSGTSSSTAPSVGAATASTAPRATTSEVVQKGNLRVNTTGKLAPNRLPRRGTAPIEVSVGGKFTTTDETLPPQLKGMRIELNRHGRLETTGLPECRVGQIHPASTRRALKACRSALVGRGSFEVEVVLAGQEPYPTKGRLLVFNGKYRGKPALLGQIYSAKPFTTSFVIPFVISKRKRGKYGLVLNAVVPPALTSWGHITGLNLNLKRRYGFKGRQRSVVSAGCPAPKGFPGALFSLARTTFRFVGGTQVTSGLTRSCKVRGGRRGG